MDLHNKTALITGASSDIGKNIALELAKQGCNIIIHYFVNRKEALALQKKIIHNFGVKTLVIKADISKEREIISMIQRIQKEFQQIDVLINNAGIAIDNDIYEKSKKEFLKILEINLVGTFIVTKEVTKIMDHGVIINISSTDGIDTYNDISMDYCASKAGINSLTKTIAMRFPHNRVYAIAPNWVKTSSTLEMSPTYLKEEMQRINQQKLIEPIDIAIKIIKTIENPKIKSGSILIIREGKS